MRPVDVNELDESKRWHEIHGEEENDAMDDMSGLVSQQTQVSKRKKAAVRRRRQVSGATAVAVTAGNGDAMDTNGIGEGG